MSCNSIILVVFLIVTVVTPHAYSESGLDQEYQIKAAFLYNFIKFVDWPKEKAADSNEPITVGIIGENPFAGAFKNKKAGGRKIVVKQFESFTPPPKNVQKDKARLQQKLETLKKCQLLFICSSEKENLTEIMSVLKGLPILIVGETETFLNAGGIVNFLVEEKKVRFEINLYAAEKAGLKIRSRLLRLAKKVFKKKLSGKQGN